VSAGYPWERPLGARTLGDGNCEFRVWAPRAKSIALRLKESADIELTDAGYGVYEAVAVARPGDDYWFVVDGQRLPDPCSRWQPDGLRGPSRVVAVEPPRRFPTPAVEDLVVYELHIGTFTAEGTFEAAIPYLQELASIGITAIEIMPVAEFPGDRGWGYDGVYISAAQSSYGGPAGLATLVQAAHERGLAVILDVVYNHLGTSGVKAMDAFGPYFTGQYGTPWGRAINYDDAGCDPVREWVLQSATGWVRDFGIDGLRLDAIHAIFDSSPEHIVGAVARRVHAVRDDALVIPESGLNDPKVGRPRERGGYACDASWADDFHHSVRTLVTDERDGYYVDFGRVAQLAKAFHRPYVHDGQYSGFRHRRFGAPAEDVPPPRFVVFSQNHDQVGNRAFGDRMPAPARPLAALCTLLSPYVPLLFMGEEYGENAPFQFFTDHIDKDIADATRDGRRKEFAAFATFEEEIPDPQSRETFERSKLTRVRDPALAQLYRELLALRRELPGGEPDVIEFDEQERWLRVRRGAFELVCNFAHQPARLSSGGSRVRIATAADVTLADGQIELPGLSGALIE
jgi:maltooligosyltrehalose trehalohydrolase